MAGFRGWIILMNVIRLIILCWFFFGLNYTKFDVLMYFCLRNFFISLAGIIDSFLELLLFFIIN